MSDYSENTAATIYNSVYQTYRELRRVAPEKLVRESMLRLEQDARKSLINARDAYFNEQRSEITYGEIHRATREQFEAARPGSPEFFEAARFMNSAYNDYLQANRLRRQASDLYQMCADRLVAILTALEDISDCVLFETEICP